MPKFRSVKEVEAQQFTQEMAAAARADPSKRGIGPFGLDLDASLGREYVACAVSDSSDIEGYTFAHVTDWVIRVGFRDFRVMNDTQFRETYKKVDIQYEQFLGRLERRPVQQGSESRSAQIDDMASESPPDEPAP